MYEVTESSPSLANDVGEALAQFYQQHIVETADQSIQVFQSFSYGEMTIALLLLLLLLTYWLKWGYEVTR